MAAPALCLMVVYLLLAFGVRVAVQMRRTGATGIISIGSAPPIEVLGGGLFFTGVVLGALNPVLALADVIEPIEALDKTGLHVAGFVLCGIGIIGTFWAQMAMGNSWRIGVDPGERTELVTGGVFLLARNPIYSLMITAWIGFSLLVPTWLIAIGGLLLVVGIEIQVRLVEEPHLLRSHDRPYRDYAARVGRFVPGLGRLG